MRKRTVRTPKGNVALPKLGRRRVRGVVLGVFPGFDGRRVVVIATFVSKNSKTGPMAQIWILRAHRSPAEVLRLGLDRSMCGGCLHRSLASGGLGTCYVNIRAPQAVWTAWRAGSYPAWDGSDEQMAALFAGRSVRFGAYGEPTLIPAPLVGRIAALASRWTGYTHHWTKAVEHKPYFRASVDSVAERDNARSHGWRTFRVSARGEGEAGARSEIVCPASDEAGKRTTCDRCALCAGTLRPSADVTIMAHGATARRLVGLPMFNRPALPPLHPTPPTPPPQPPGDWDDGPDGLDWWVEDESD